MKIHHGFSDGWHEWIIGKQGGNQIRIGLSSGAFFVVARIWDRLFLKMLEWRRE